RRSGSHNGNIRPAIEPKGGFHRFLLQGPMREHERNCCSGASVLAAASSLSSFVRLRWDHHPRIVRALSMSYSLELSLSKESARCQEGDRSSNGHLWGKLLHQSFVGQKVMP